MIKVSNKCLTWSHFSSSSSITLFIQIGTHSGLTSMFLGTWILWKKAKNTKNYRNWWIQFEKETKMKRLKSCLRIVWCLSYLCVIRYSRTWTAAEDKVLCESKYQINYFEMNNNLEFVWFRFSLWTFIFLSWSFICFSL